jgi:multiple sugar transport system substrate-binding protein
MRDLHMQRESHRICEFFHRGNEPGAAALKLLTNQGAKFWEIHGILFLIIFQTGCNRPSPTPAVVTRHYEALSVRVGCPSETAAAIVARYGPAWTAQTGARIEVLRYNPDLVSPSELPGDVWLVPPARMPHWAAAGKLLEVPERYASPGSSYGWDGLLRDWRFKLLIWDQKVYALPLLGDAFLCFYRADLMADPENRSAFKKKYGRTLAPPKTWEDFAAIAEFFHNQKRPGIDRPCSSLPPLPNRDDDLDREFFAVAASLARRALAEDTRRSSATEELFSFHYDVEAGLPRIAGPGFVRALETLRRLQECRPGATATEPPARFAEGEAVLCLASPSWIERFQRDGKLRGKFDFQRLPGSRLVFEHRTGEAKEVGGDNYVPYLGAGGLVGVVPRSSAQPDAAFALLAFLSDPRTSSDIVIEPAWGGGVFRADHLDSRVGWQAFGLDPSQTAHLLECVGQDAVHSRVKNPVFRLRMPDEQEHQKALLEEVRACLLHGKRAHDTLTDAARRWSQLDARLGLQVRRTYYRLSLGLTGRG